MTTSRNLTIDDLWTFKDVDTVALSPDGKRLAYVVHRLDKVKNEHQSAIWVLQLDEHGRAEGVARQLTSGIKNDSRPRWSPDSMRLLFLSDREEQTDQLWLIDADGGEASRLTNMLHGVREAAWSPDGQFVAFTALAASTDDDDLLIGRKTLSADEKMKREEEERIRFRTITRILYRWDGRGFFDKFTQLFVMPVPSADKIQVDPATIRCLTSGDFDHSGPSWTPDCTEIGVLCNRAENRDRSFINDLWAISCETGAARLLSEGTLEIESYSWSPDGKLAILVAAKDRRIEGSSNARLYLVSREGGCIQDMTAAIDNHVTPAAFNGYDPSAPYTPRWSSDSKRIYFLVTERACINCYQLDREENTVTALTSGERLFYNLSLLPGERGLVVAQALPLHLLEVYLLPLPVAGAGAMVQLTHVHDEQMDEFAWSKSERIHYRGGK
jgi:dipeptidyl aminopeptidase/acylaminoacyl peptidase